VVPPGVGPGAVGGGVAAGVGGGVPIVVEEQEGVVVTMEGQAVSQHTLALPVERRE
jgi:hypothetical protein